MVDTPLTKHELRSLTAHLGRLSTRLRKTLRPKTTRQRMLPMSEMPPDIALLFCPRCYAFQGAMGCPKHRANAARRRKPVPVSYVPIELPLEEYGRSQ